MATDFNKPVVTDAYATLLPGLVTANKDLARMLEPTLTGTSTNIPTGAVRWNAATIRWERYNGTSWVTLPAAGDNVYAISISGNAATATSATTATKLAAGVAGAIPYQSAVGATAFTEAGTSGYILKSNGAGAPTWVAQSTLSVGSATTAGSCSGNAATATTATTAWSCSGNAATATNVVWSGITSKPTTVAGYGISDMGSQSVNYAASSGEATKLTSSIGAAPSYACRAWVNFNGTGAVNIRPGGSGNVSSITDLGTGSFRINFATAMPDANYAFVGGGGYPGTSGADAMVRLQSAPNAASVEILTYNASNVAVDREYVFAAVFR